MSKSGGADNDWEQIKNKHRPGPLGNSGIDMGLTGTFGYGFGGFGHAGSLTQTVVSPFYPLRGFVFL